MFNDHPSPPPPPFTFCKGHCTLFRLCYADVLLVWAVTYFLVGFLFLTKWTILKTISIVLIPCCVKKLIGLILIQSQYYYKVVEVFNLNKS